MQGQSEIPRRPNQTAKLLQKEKDPGTHKHKQTTDKVTKTLMDRSSRGCKSAADNLLVN